MVQHQEQESDNQDYSHESPLAAKVMIKMNERADSVKLGEQTMQGEQTRLSAA